MQKLIHSVFVIIRANQRNPYIRVCCAAARKAEGCPYEQNKHPLLSCFKSLKGQTVRSQTQSRTSRIQTDSEENQVLKVRVAGQKSLFFSVTADRNMRLLLNKSM